MAGSGRESLEIEAAERPGRRRVLDRRGGVDGVPTAAFAEWNPIIPATPVSLQKLP